jgi:TonB family protein
MDKWKDLAGQVVNGEFRLIEYLGGSDASAVFLTQRNGQKAAIKLVPAVSRNTEIQLSRWSAAQNLSHPNLVRLFASGRCELNRTEFLFVVMEYAEENLSQVVAQRALTAAEVKDMLPQVLNALTYVHAKGFVQGQLKPANILANGDQLKISTDSVCNAGERGGARRSIYDAPESTLSPAADVWSLGVTLVEALSQRLPAWDGYGDPIPPHNLPVPFLEIARHCLSFDPQRRPTTREILERLQARPAATARKQTAISAPVRERSRFIVPIAAAVLVFGFSFGAVRLLRHRPEPQPVKASVQPSPSPRLELKQASASPKLKPTPVISEPHPRAQTVVEQPPSASPRVAPASFDSPAKPKVVTGALIPGDVLQKVLPQVPERARDTIHGTVRVAVRVHVDSNGNVVGTRFDSFGPSKYFARLAQDAARHWKFDPPSRDGQDQSSEWLLRFEFTQRGTRVIPVAASS